MKSIYLSYRIIIACLCILPVALLYGQDDEMDRPALKRLEQLKKVKLIEALDLNEDQAIKFFTREKDYRLAERKLIKERIHTADDLEILVKTDTREAEIIKKVGEISEIEKKIITTRWDFLNSVRDVLTPKQIGQLVLFERKFQQEVRRILRDMPPGPRMKQ